MTIHRSVRALSRGLALIGELNTSGPSSAQQLAARSGLNRTTCYRLLQTLQQEGYVTFDETSALFGLTPQVRRLSEGLSTQDLSRQAALPPMFGLLEQVSWPSDFAVFELGWMMIRESTHSFSPFSVHRSMVGLGRSLVRSALGRAVLTAATSNGAGVQCRPSLGSGTGRRDVGRCGPLCGEGRAAARAAHQRLAGEPFGRRIE
jgi:IclR family mhp operon transcriptional activator